MPEGSPPWARRRVLAALKRAVDVAATLVLLVVGSPVILGVSIATLVTLGKPVLFRQPRLGLQGRIFVLLKFRTMSEAKDERGELLPDRERLGRLGRFTRRLSLDEFPALFNVLTGDLSLVGPRPLLVEYRELYSPRQRRRHLVPPGLVGPVTAYGRNALSWEEKFELDCWYVDNWSLWLDLRLLVRSLWQALAGRGISAAGHVTMPKFTGSDQGEPPG